MASRSFTCNGAAHQRPEDSTQKSIEENLFQRLHVIAHQPADANQQLLVLDAQVHVGHDASEVLVQEAQRPVPVLLKKKTSVK